MTDLTAIEDQLRDAIDTGGTHRINTLAAKLDAADAQRKPSPSVLAAALWYASVGLHIFPIQPGSKVPHPGSHGCKDATDDETTIRAWWDRWPDSNVAIATGHLVDVIDIDGPTGQVSRARHWPKFDKLHVLGVVNTPRPGGMHIYVPTSGHGNKAGLLPGIDHRGIGGYVVAPPSVRPEGTYTWTRPLDVAAMKAAA